MEKTIEQWFKELPKEHSEKAIQNTIDCSDKYFLKRKEKSLKEALSGGFEWRKTPEGADYWLNVYNELNHLKSE